MKGRCKSEAHRRAISEALMRYWATIPHKILQTGTKQKPIELITCQGDKTCQSTSIVKNNILKNRDKDVEL